MNGGELNPDLVKAARQEEMGYVLSRDVYRPSSLAECLKVTGRKPIRTGWSDSNKGDITKPNYRSRLVAKECKWMSKLGGAASARRGHRRTKGWGRIRSR